MYATLAQLKERLNIPAVDTDRDGELTAVLAATGEDITERCGHRTFTLSSTASARQMTTSGNTVAEPDGEILLLPWDIGSLVGLQVHIGSARAGWTDITTLIDPWPVDAPDKSWPWTQLLYVGGKWPSGSAGQAKVTAVWGWPAVPAKVPQAELLMAARLWGRRESPQGIIGSAEWGAMRVNRWDPDVEQLLRGLGRTVGF
jgi:hypothetical protein